jgi:hypothetical protein
VVARGLIVFGVVLIVLGLLLKAGVPLGRLPGDLSWQRGNSTFYLPLVTCLLLSVVLSVILALLRR